MRPHGGGDQQRDQEAFNRAADETLKATVEHAMDRSISFSARCPIDQGSTREPHDEGDTGRQDGVVARLFENGSVHVGP